MPSLHWQHAASMLHDVSAQRLVRVVEQEMSANSACNVGTRRAGLQSQQWGRKKAAALAAARMAGDGADALRPHVLALLNALLAEVSGLTSSIPCTAGPSRRVYVSHKGSDAPSPPSAMPV